MLSQLEAFNDSRPTNDPGRLLLNNAYGHFQKFKNYPFWVGVDIHGWNKDVSLKEFFCDPCRKWLLLSTTTHTLVSHASSNKHKKNIGEQVDDLEERPSSMTIAKALTKFILVNGHPFSMAEDTILRTITNDLPCRQKMAEMANNSAEDVRTEIKRRLQNAKYISATTDEWSSLAGTRFLAINVHATINDEIQVFTISHQHIAAITFDAPRARDMFISVLRNFGIYDRVGHIITDSGSVIKSALKDLEIPWHPCICHQINLFVGKFVKAMNPFFDPIFKLQASLSHSTKFSEFLHQSDFNKRRTIPSFCVTRWYSLAELIEAISDLEPLIKSFSQQFPNSLQVQESVFGIVADVKPFFQLLRASYSKLESENFGAISFALPIFKLAEYFVDNNLRDDKYAEAVTAFKEAFEEHRANVIKEWTPIIEAATILNPQYRSKEILQKKEYKEGKRFILEQLEKEETQVKQQKKMQEYKKDKLKLSNYDGFLTSSQQTIQNGAKGEFAKYKNHFVGQGDIIDIWRSTRTILPNLSRVAESILSIPPSSAASERQFSVSRRVLGLNRLAMDPDTVEATAIIAGNPEISDEVI